VGARTIRDAGPGDVEAITALTNALIAATTYDWTEVPYSVEDRRAWLAAKAAAGMPVLVAEDGGEVVGWAGYGDFLPGVGDKFGRRLDLVLMQRDLTR
jgi:L-amino acid N-acyltransferase YncA